MYNFKKFVALGMAAVMVLGCGVTSFAANPGDEGEDVEVSGEGTPIFADKDVYVITVPTGAALTDTFKYQTDPYGLVLQADSTKKIEDDARVLFAKAAADLDYSGTSDTLEIVNKGSVGVTLAMSAEIDTSGTPTYAAGYSTTKDFSGTGDDAKGLYFGIIADNEVEKALKGDAAVEFTNAVISAADQYEVKENAGVYTYELKSGASDFPKYEFAMTGALNTGVADDTWYTVKSDKSKEAKTMPTLKVTFTPTAIRECTQTEVLVEGDDFYISKAGQEGGFGTTKPTALEINGKTVSTVSDNVEGYVHVGWKDVYTAWGYNDTTINELPEEDQLKIFNGVKTFKFTVGGVKYYAEVTEE